LNLLVSNLEFLVGHLLFVSEVDIIFEIVVEFLVVVLILEVALFLQHDPLALLVLDQLPALLALEEGVEGVREDLLYLEGQELVYVFVGGHQEILVCLDVELHDPEAVGHFGLLGLLLLYVHLGFEQTCDVGFVAVCVLLQVFEQVLDHFDAGVVCSGDLRTLLTHVLEVLDCCLVAEVDVHALLPLLSQRVEQILLVLHDAVLQLAQLDVGRVHVLLVVNRIFVEHDDFLVLLRDVGG